MKTAHELVMAARQSIREVTLEEVSLLVSAGALLVDVREPEEFAAGRVPGAINIPRGLLEFKVQELAGIDRPGTTVLLYCKSGGRAALCAQSLQLMELSGVVSMAGGFDAWQAAGFPVERPVMPSFD